MNAIHQNSPHTHQDIVFYIAGMQNSIMAHRDIVSNMHPYIRRKVNRHVILNIGTCSDTDFGKVGANNRIVKHRGIIPDFYVTNKPSSLGNKNSIAKERLFTLIFNQTGHINQNFSLL